jgi:hypothetical protein
MATHPKPAIMDRAKIQKLLDDHACPVPLHEVRTRFMGNIATPKMRASPVETLKGLWGDEMPVADSIDDLNHLINTLINGLWNTLTRHQKRNAPFKLTRDGSLSGLDGLAGLALMRRQELDGFMEGLFDGEDTIDLPEKAHSGVEVLADIRSMFAAAYELLASGTKPADTGQLEKTFKHMQELTIIAEKEIHAVILSCTKSRARLLATYATENPTLH